MGKLGDLDEKVVVAESVRKLEPEFSDCVGPMLLLNFVMPYRWFSLIQNGKCPPPVPPGRPEDIEGTTLQKSRPCHVKGLDPFVTEGDDAQHKQCEFHRVS